MTDEFLTLDEIATRKHKAKSEQRRQDRLATLADRADKMYAKARALGQERLGKMLHYAAIQLVDHENPYYFAAIDQLKMVPVTIDEFIESNEFWENQMDVWPALRSDLRAINPDVMCGEDPVYEALLGGATGCVDAATEFLTPTGWKRIDRYVPGDHVAQYHRDGAISFVAPHEYVKRPCAWFYHLHTAYGVDQALSPEHRVYYQTTKGHPAIRSAQEIVDAHANAAYGWRGKFYTTFSHNGEGTGLTEAQLRVQVAVLADAYLASKSTCVANLKRHDKIERLRRLLDEAGIPYSVRAVASTGYTHIRFAPPIMTKAYGDWAWQATQDELRTITDEAMYWDARSGKRNQFYSTDKTSADFIQFAFSATGKRATIGVDHREGRNDCYVVTVSCRTMVAISKGAGDKPEIRRIPSEDGFKYCFEVPTSLLVLRRNGRVFITGNTGKTATAHTTQAYQLYFLNCFRSPQRLFGLAASTNIVFMFQSVRQDVTERVIYKPFRQMFLDMPFSRRWLNHDPYKESVLRFDNNIEVVPALANVESMIGQAIASAILDEVNFMSVVEQSKMVAGPRGQGGKYDQAEEIYRTISRRRKSRFTSRGPAPGVLTVLSSTRYKGDFLDRRQDEINKNAEPFTLVFRHKQYDVQPQEKYSGERFRLLVGTGDYGTRVLEAHEEPGIHYPEKGRIEEVPVEYIHEFRNDPDNAMRDVCGIATDTIHAFITQRHKIVEAILRGREVGLNSFLYKDNVVLGEDGLPQINEDLLPDDRDERRFIHVDLSLTGDRCGIAMVKVKGHVAVADDNGVVENLPYVQVELATSIQPSPQFELDISDVRRWIMMLHTYYGFNIHHVSYDGFQSSESMQMLRRAGIRSSGISVDTKTEPYEDLRRMLYQDRLDIIDNDLLKVELSQLEHHEEKNKIDHPPKGSKDIADAVCGAINAAINSRRERNDTVPTDTQGNRIRSTERGGRRNPRRR